MKLNPDQTEVAVVGLAKEFVQKLDGAALLRLGVRLDPALLLGQPVGGSGQETVTRFTWGCFWKHLGCKG